MPVHDRLLRGALLRPLLGAGVGALGVVLLRGGLLHRCGGRGLRAALREVLGEGRVVLLVREVRRVSIVRVVLLLRVECICRVDVGLIICVLVLAREPVRRILTGVLEATMP